MLASVPFGKKLQHLGMRQAFVFGTVCLPLFLGSVLASPLWVPSSLVLMECTGFYSLGCVSPLVLRECAGFASLNCLTPTAISFYFPL